MSFLKIGIVCYPSVGGSGIVATNLGLELSKLGHEVHFISYEPPFRLMGKHKNIFFHKVHINEYSLFKYPDYTLPLAVEIGNVHEKHELDIVHVHYAVPHATAALLAKDMIKQCSHCKPPKIITTLHGTDITLLAQDKSLDEVIKFSIEKSDGVTAVSENLKKDTLKILKTKKPIEVIYNFYSPPKPTKSRANVRKGLKIKNDDLLGIHLSNLRPVKRIPDLLEITARIKNPRYKLLILAGGDFKPYLPLVKKLGIQNKLIIKEKVTSIENYINASDLAIFTSETESFGLGALECMSYGLPVLATTSGGTPEVLEHNKTGLLSKVGDIKDFAKNLNKLILDTDLRKQMGENAKKIASEKFSSSKIVPRYVEYYKKILSQKSSP
jgi:N-acetyl-alpha-D-glucosaminyl L-malate synthase BshA